MSEAPQPSDTSTSDTRIRRVSSRGLPRLWRLCQKELREILRDRRTIVTLVLMPILVYPVLSLVFQRFLITGATREKAEAIYRIGVSSQEHAAVLYNYLARGQQLLARDAKKADTDAGRTEASQADSTPQRGQVFTATETLARSDRGLQWLQIEDTSQILDVPIDLAVRVELLQPSGPFPTEEEIAAGAQPRITPARFELTYQSRTPMSEAALEFIQQRLQAVNEAYARQRMVQLGGDGDLPVTIIQREATKESNTAVSLSSLIPLILLLMTITGAVYPAIDLTAGERERGTLEALIAAPVSRVHVLLSKYVAVVTVALLTALANLLAMAVTLQSTGLGTALFGESLMTGRTLFQVFLLLVLFAAFFSAVLLAVTSFARSFKEAQAYLIPLMLISLAPGLFSLLPNVEFRGPLTVTPLVNIVLLARDLFKGSVNPASAVAAVVSTILYAAAAISVAARVFGTDAVLYGSTSSWSDLFQRPENTRGQASMSGALMFLAVLFPLYILLANTLARFKDSGIEVVLTLSIAITVVLFGVLPIAAALISRIRIADAFYLRSAPLLAFLAAGLLGVSLWPLVYELVLAHRLLGIAALTPERIEGVKELIASWQTTSPFLLIFAMAISPAIFEELFFRGFLFSALRNKLTPRKTIIITALLFGVFHVLTSAISIERFLPSTCMGLVLGWVCWKTRSVLPGILLHACHNGLVVTIGIYKDWLMANNWGDEQRIHLPAYWIGFAILGTISGIFVLRYVANSATPWDSLDAVESA
ncbi:MAG: ABC transporter permease subunit/CPBP intramembrane protease [Planctomycetota bacterium]